MAVDPLLGEIMMFAGNFAPRGWAFCDGQLLPIAQNDALFSLLGTTYGGDGRTTFALPDLRGRAPIHAGNGPGLSNYQLGWRGGAETTTLSISNLPSHNHTLNASEQPATTAEPLNNYLPHGETGRVEAKEYVTPPPYSLVSLNNESIGYTGGSQPFNNVMPFLTINFCIALQGIFPSRS